MEKGWIHHRNLDQFEVQKLLGFTKRDSQQNCNKNFADLWPIPGFHQRFFFVAEELLVIYIRGLGMPTCQQRLTLQKTHSLLWKIAMWCLLTVIPKCSTQRLLYIAPTLLCDMDWHTLGWFWASQNQSHMVGFWDTLWIFGLSTVLLYCISLSVLEFVFRKVVYSNT